MEPVLVPDPVKKERTKEFYEKNNFLGTREGQDPDPDPEYTKN
jgi:hypothetical protein